MKSWCRSKKNDAQLAISIARGILSKLKALPWQLVPLSAVHSNGEIDAPAHDLVLKATAGGLKGKLFSVEIKCREVKLRRPSGFNWQDDMQKRADVLWQAELEHSSTPWAARILVFCELPRPCHTGDWQLHASIRWLNKPWVTLFGWRGFPPIAPSAAMPASPPVQAPRGQTDEDRPGGGRS